MHRVKNGHLGMLIYLIVIFLIPCSKSLAACDPILGCDPREENVFLDRQSLKYWMSETGKKTLIKVKRSKSSGKKPISNDFVPVTIQYDDKATETKVNYNFRIQKHMMSRGNVGLDGPSTAVLTETSFNEADDYCIQMGKELFGEPMQVAQLYQFEHALRQQKILADPGIGTEMVVIPDNDRERGQLVLTNDNFPFRSSHIKMLLFNWMALTYSTALQTKRGDFGFRCMKEEHAQE
jgi:hypothetical protein